jgi:branched-chain amino acid aminotransferase
MECLKSLLKLESKWIPEENGFSLYIRPTLIGTQNSLGVGPSNKALLFVIMSPVGPYYPEGWKPIKLLADDRYVRAWPGGTGNSKLGGNYAPCILPQIEANKKGYTQVLWLFGPERDVTEVGTMNFFLYWTNKQGEKELVTPPLDGTILPGVTRDSILQLARKWNEFKVSERKITIFDILDGVKENRVIEAFGSGTAAVVSPIKLISYHAVDYSIPIDTELGIGKLTKRFADTILGIQYGKIPSEWSVKI